MATKDEDNALFADLEKAHGAENVRRIQTICGMMVVKKPSRIDCRRAMQMGLSSQMHPGYGDAVEHLARAGIVHPTPEAFDVILEREPLLYLRLAPAMLDLAGLRSVEEGKG